MKNKLNQFDNWQVYKLQQMQDQSNTENLILQLKNLIKDNQKSNSNQIQSTLIKKAHGENDYEKMLLESSRMVSESQQSSKRQQTKNKILAASELLKDQQSNLIKNYIKQKISSELFGNKNNLTPQQSALFEQQKRQILLQRERQIEEQRQRRKKLIQNVREYDNNPATNIPILQIDRILQKQEPDSSYLIKYMNSQGKKLSSDNNKLKNTNLSIDQIYSIQEYQKRQTPSKYYPQRSIQGQEQFQEVSGQYQQQNVEAQYFTNSREGKVFALLSKNMNFVKIFYRYLQNQSKINSLNNVYQSLPGFIKSQEQKQRKQKILNEKYFWTNKPKQYKKKPVKKQSISDITKIYRAKGVIIVPNSSIKLEKSIVCQKQINKMIGEGQKFHPKKCILTTEQLLYFQDKGGKPDYKTIQLFLQKLQTNSGKKDQGSFFSKKAEDIQIVTVKGKNRIFKFEKNYLEGLQLFYEITKLMALKLHFLNSKIHGRSNNSIINFILNEKSQKLNLGNQYLQLAQNYPAQQHRQMTLQLILQLFPIRKQVKELSLQYSRLTSLEINSILNKCQSFENLSTLNLEKNRLQKQNIQTIFQLINRNQTVKNFKLNLTNTKIDDQMISANSGIINLASQKINYLNLSSNSITGKSANVIKSCLQIITCQIKHLQINDCPIKQIYKVASLIKQAKNLQILSIKSCGLSLDQKDNSQLQTFFSSLKRTVIKQIYLNGNGCVKNLQILQDNWSSESLQQVFLDVKINELQFVGSQIKLLKGQISTKRQ